MANKVSKSEKIRTLLAKGLSAKEVAKKVGVSAPYVYQVSWHDKQKKAEKKAGKKTVKKVKVARAADITEQLLLPEIPVPSSVYSGFDPWAFIDTVQATDTETLRKARAFLASELDRRQTI